jgi:ribosome-associated heat shock protein Hsp15
LGAKAGIILAGMQRDAMQGAGPPGSMRVDLWLFAVRLFKSRSLATQAVSGGRVHVNGERVKPSRAVRIGDAVAFARGAVDFDCTVLGLPLRRGPATEAARCYRESEGSVARRAQFVERMRLAAALAPRPDARPDKHERRELRRMRGRDG